jgi:hypothetical protein
MLTVPTVPALAAIAQFDFIIQMGETYLMPFSKFLAASVFVLAAAASQHPDPGEAAKWKWYLAAGVVVIQIAWFEARYIFPINDEVRAMGAKGHGSSDQSKFEKVLGERLQRWRQYHAVRTALPGVAAVMVCVASTF